MQFCTTERPQLFVFEVASCRTCRLRYKKAILEVATSLHADLTPPTAHISDLKQQSVQNIEVTSYEKKKKIKVPCKGQLNSE